MAQDWETPAPNPSVPPAQNTWWQDPNPAPATIPVPQLSAAYALRPLSTGEVLDRTFSIYRPHVWLFAGLASISGGFSLLLNAIQLLIHHVVLLHSGLRIAQFEAQGWSFVALVLMVPVQAVIYAASVFALCEIYLGREITAKDSLRATAGRWARYVGIALWQGWSAVWLFILLAVPGLVVFGFGAAGKNLGIEFLAGALLLLGTLGGGVYGVIAYIRNSLAIPAALMELSGVRVSMRRSKTLAAGTKGRIFVVLLIATALYFVAAAIESPLLFVIGKTPFQEHVLAQAIILLVGFVAHTFVSPVALIGLTLVYFDQRVRQEGFDILMLMGPEPIPAAAPVESSWAVAPAATPVDVVFAAPAPVVTAPLEAIPTDETLPPRTDDETLP